MGVRARMGAAPGPEPILGGVWALGQATFENLHGPFENLQGPFENIQGPFENIQGPLENIQGPFENIQGSLENTQGSLWPTSHVGRCAVASGGSDFLKNGTWKRRAPITRSKPRRQS